MKVPPYGFISYAHDDFSVFEALRKQLIAIERRFRIKFHEDTDLTGGDTVDPAIQAMIDQSHVFVLLTSAAFIASGYIFDIELPAIETRKNAAKGLIIPVVLNRCDHDLVHGRLEQVPKVAKRLKPVDQWERPNDAYDCARDQISRAIARHYGVKYP